MVPIKSHSVEFKVAFPYLVVIADHTRPEHTVYEGIAVSVILHGQHCTGASEVSRQDYPEMHVCAKLYGACGISVSDLTRIKKHHSI